MKTCTKCGEDKDESLYHKDRKGKNGLKSWCKACNRADTLSRYNTPIPTVLEKQCTTCLKVKSISEFNKDRLKKDGVHPTCRECKRDYQYLRLYGLSREEYRALLSQGCQACGNKLSRIVIDHCHTTGKVRGSLCSNCNTALGLLNEDPLRMHNLVNYILRTS